MKRKKSKVHSGMFPTERIACSLEDNSPQEINQAIKECFQRIPLDNLLKGFEHRAAEVLGELRYPVTLQGLRVYAQTDLPPRIQDIRSMLLRLEEVRDCAKKGDVEGAAKNAILMMYAAWRADMRLMETTVRTGSWVEESGKRTGQYRGDTDSTERIPLWEDWQNRADRIWAKFPSYAVLRVAKMIENDLRKENEPPSWETIRKRIRKKQLTAFYL